MDTRRSAALAVFLFACLVLYGGGTSEGATTKGTAGEQATPKAAAGGSFQRGIVVYPTLSDYRAKMGRDITEFHEAPELADMVAGGRLPPVAERLPKEPLVVKPLEAIGKYGGDIRVGTLSPRSWSSLQTQSCAT